MTASTASRGPSRKFTPGRLIAGVDRGIGPPRLGAVWSRAPGGLDGAR